MEQTIAAPEPQVLLDTCLKIVKTLYDVRPWLKPVPLTMTTITNECLELRELLSRSQELDRYKHTAHNNTVQLSHSIEAFFLGCSMTISVVDEYAMDLYEAVTPARSEVQGLASKPRIQQFWKDTDMKELLSQIRCYQDRLRSLLEIVETSCKDAAGNEAKGNTTANQAAITTLLHRSHLAFLRGSNSSCSSLRDSFVSLDPSPPYALSLRGDYGNMEDSFGLVCEDTTSSQEKVTMENHPSFRGVHPNVRDTEALVDLVRNAADMRKPVDAIKEEATVANNTIIDTRDKEDQQIQDIRVPQQLSTQDPINRSTERPTQKVIKKLQNKSRTTDPRQDVISSFMIPAPPNLENVRGQAVTSGKVTRYLGELRGHADWILSVAFSPDGATIASGSRDGSVRIWDAATGGQLRELTGHAARVCGVAFSPDGATIASGSSDKSVRIWDAATGGQLRELTGHTARVWSVAFSPDGATIASGSSDKSVRIWDAATGGQLRELTGHTARVWSVAFSPDGATIASGSSDKSVRIWDAATGGQLRELTGHADWVLSVAFSPDGATIASGTRDGSVRIWDAATGGQLRELTGHAGWVWGVAFSPDGATIASRSSDGSVRIWDAATGRQLRELTGHTARVWSVAFSPDGATIASGSRDGS